MAYSASGYEYRIGVTADVNGAKKALQDLQDSLSQIVQKSSQPSDFALTKHLQQASRAAIDLKARLTAATDVSTGKLDLSKFSTSLEKSNMSLAKYRQSLSMLGSEGENAFLALTRSISSADAKISNSSSLLSRFATSLKNVAQYQLSTKLYTSIIGTFTNAFSYAKELNEALNKIQIVTGASDIQMANFAKTANEAAKALSISTKEYAQASLIFYQQGLKGSAVTDRTNIVAKMTHATGDSAEEVSSYLTAIWNNFASGSKNLQQFADTITALGASTASSSSEIAEGLSKFAAIAQTTGLSYDYATSALATLVATTRESADTVGSSLKTIFSRLQSLSLGETLDDGVNLTKYTKALNAIGVSVIDANGSLRNMDTILEDLGARWQQLGSEQKMALAQTVAGVRQYNNLIALLDNWDVMQKNLRTAQNSQGTLDRQQAIYEKSWAASKKRVQAAAEGIYDSVIDDKFFIGLNDTFAKIIENINDLINNLGGFKGVLLQIGAIATTVFNKQLANGLRNISTGVKDLFTFGHYSRNKDIAFREEAISQATKVYSNYEKDIGGEALRNTAAQEFDTQKAFLKNAQNMSDLEKNIYQQRMDSANASLITLKNFVAQNKELRNEVSAQKELLRVKNQVAFKSSEHEQQYQKAAQNQQQVLNARALQTTLLPADRYWDINSSAVQQEDARAKLNMLYSGLQSMGLSDTEVFGQNIAEALSHLRDLLNTGGEGVGDALTNLENAIEDRGNQVSNEMSQLLENMAMAAAQKTVSGVTPENIHDFISARDRAQQMDEAISENAARVQLLGAGSEAAQPFQAAQAVAQEAFNEAQAQMVSLRQQVPNIEAAVRTYEETAARLNNGSDQVAQAGEKLAKNLIQTGSQAGVVKTGFDSLHKSLANFKQDIAQNISLMGQTAMSAASMVRGVMGMVSAIKGMRDETQSFVDVLLTIPTIIMGIGMTMNAVNKLIEAGMGPIGLAVAIVTTAIVAAISFYNKLRPETQAEKLERLIKENEELSSQLDEANNAAQELKDTFDEYDSIQSTLKDCVQGTEEWNTALAKANGLVLDLIKQYPSLIKNQDYWRRNSETGLIELTEEGKQFLTDETAETVRVTQGAYIYNSQQVRENREISSSLPAFLLLNPNQQDEVFETISTALGIAFGDRLTPDQLELLAQENGYNQGMLYSGRDTNLFSVDGEDRQQLITEEDLDKVKNLWKNKYLEDFKNNVYDSQDQLPFWNEAGEFQEDIFDIWFDTIVNTIKNDSRFQGAFKDTDLYEQELTQVAIDVLTTAGLSYGMLNEATQTIMGKAYSTAFNKEIQTIKEQLAKEDETAKALLKQYGIDVFGNDTTFELKDVNWDKKTVKFTKADGSQTGAISFDSIAGGLATQQWSTNQDYVNQIKAYQGATARLKNSEKATERALYSALANSNLNELTSAEIGEIDTNVIDTLDPEIEMTIKAITGITNIKEYLQDKIDQYNEAVNAIWKDATFKPDRINTDKMNLNVQLALKKRLESIQEALGPDVLNQILNQFADESIDDAKIADIFTNVLSYENVEDFTQALTEVGFSFDSLGINAQTLYEHLTSTSRSVKDVMDNYAATAAIINKLNIGDTIKKEEWESLDSNIQDFFVLTLDGTYQLIKGAKELNKAARQNTVTQLKEEWSELQQQQIDWRAIGQSQPTFDSAIQNNADLQAWWTSWNDRNNKNTVEKHELETALVKADDDLKEATEWAQIINGRELSVAAYRKNYSALFDLYDLEIDKKLEVLSRYRSQIQQIQQQEASQYAQGLPLPEGFTYQDVMDWFDAAEQAIKLKNDNLVQGIQNNAVGAAMEAAENQISEEDFIANSMYRDFFSDEQLGQQYKMAKSTLDSNSTISDYSLFNPRTGYDYAQLEESLIQEAQKYYSVFSDTPPEDFSLEQWFSSMEEMFIDGEEGSLTDLVKIFNGDLASTSFSTYDWTPIFEAMKEEFASHNWEFPILNEDGTPSLDIDNQIAALEELKKEEEAIVETLWNTPSEIGLWAKTFDIDLDAANAAKKTAEDVVSNIESALAQVDQRQAELDAEYESHLEDIAGSNSLLLTEFEQNGAQDYVLRALNYANSQGYLNEQDQKLLESYKKADAEGRAAQLADLVQLYQDKFASDTELQQRYDEHYEEQRKSIISGMAAAATTVDELHTYLFDKTSGLGLGETDQDAVDAYSEGLQRIASGYDSCKFALLAYQTALQNPSEPKVIQEAQEALETEILLNELAKETDQEVEQLRMYAKAKYTNGEPLTKDKVTALGQDLAQDAAKSDIISNWATYQELGQKSASSGISTTDLIAQDYDTLSKLQATIGGLGKLSKEATQALSPKTILDFAEALNTGKEAFVAFFQDLLGEANVKVDEYEALFDELTKKATANDIKTYTDTFKGSSTTFNSAAGALTNFSAAMELLNANFAAGYVSAQNYWSILQEIMSAAGAFTSGAQFALISDAIKDFEKNGNKLLINGQEIQGIDRDSFLQALNGYYQDSDIATSDKIETEKVLAGQTIKYTDEKGQPHEFTYHAAESRARIRELYKSANDMYYSDIEAGLRAQLNEINNDAELTNSMRVAEKRAVNKIRISNISSTSDLYDTEKLDKLTSMDVGDSAASIYDIQHAVADLIATSEQFSFDEKLAALNTVFKENNYDLKLYKDTLIKIIANDSTQDSKEKLAAILTQIQKGINFGTAYSEIITKIISSDASTTTAEKVAQINQAIEQGLLKLKDFKEAYAELWKDNETTPIEKAQTLEEAEAQVPEVLKAEAGSKYDQYKNTIISYNEKIDPLEKKLADNHQRQQDLEAQISAETDESKIAELQAQLTSAQVEEESLNTTLEMEKTAFDRAQKAIFDTETNSLISREDYIANASIDTEQVALAQQDIADDFLRNFDVNSASFEDIKAVLSVADQYTDNIGLDRFLFKNFDAMFGKVSSVSDLDRLTEILDKYQYNYSNSWKKMKDAAIEAEASARAFSKESLAAMIEYVKSDSEALKRMGINPGDTLTGQQELALMRIASLQLQAVTGWNDITAAVKKYQDAVKKGEKSNTVVGMLDELNSIAKGLEEVYGVTFGSDWILKNADTIAKASGGDDINAQAVLKEEAIRILFKENDVSATDSLLGQYLSNYDFTTELETGELLPAELLMAADELIIKAGVVPSEVEKMFNALGMTLDTTSAEISKETMDIVKSLRGITKREGIAESLKKTGEEALKAIEGIQESWFGGSKAKSKVQKYLTDHQDATLEDALKGVSYEYRSTTNTSVAAAGTVGQTYQVLKDGKGNFIDPQTWLNNMERLTQSEEFNKIGELTSETIEEGLNSIDFESVGGDAAKNFIEGYMNSHPEATVEEAFEAMADSMKGVSGELSADMGEALASGTPEVDEKEYASSMNVPLSAAIPYLNENGQPDIATSTGSISGEGKTVLPFLSDGNGTGTSNPAPTRSRNSGGGGRRRRVKPKEIDRYHYQKRTLESVQHQLNQIDKVKSQAFGKDKVSAIGEETNALNRQIDAQKAYLKEIERYRQEDLKKIIKWGFEVDEEGNLSNYEQIWKKEADRWERDMKAGKEDAANERWEQFEKEIKKYEESVNLLDSESEKLVDMQQKIIDVALEAITTITDLKLAINDFDISIIDEYLSNIGNSADVAADAIVHLGQQLDVLTKKRQNYIDDIVAIMKDDKLGNFSDDLIARFMEGTYTAADLQTLRNANLSSAIMERLQSSVEGLLGTGETARQYRDAAIQRLTDAFAEYNDELQKNIDIMERLSSVTNTYLSIIDVVGPALMDATGELRQSLSRTQYDIQRNTTAALRAQLSMQDQAIDEHKAKINSLIAEGEVVNAATIKLLKDNLYSMEQTRADTYQSWLESWEASCQAAADIYTTTMESIVNTMTSIFAGAMGSVDELQSRFENQKSLNEIYLTDYDKIYELTKLTRDINKSLDESDNIKNKQKLISLIEEINVLQEQGVKVSKYDTDELRARYELQVALDELEKARENKTTVRMQRDSEGNYGYVYTADADEVEKAEQNYEDKLHEMQVLNSEYITSVQESIIKAQADCAQALSELNASDFSSYEEYMEKAQYIRDYYSETVESYYQQLDDVIAKNRRLYTEDWQAYSEANDYRISADLDYIDKFTETMLSRLTGFSSITDALDTFGAGVEEAFEGALIAWKTWYDDTQMAMSDGQTTIEDYGATVTEQLGNITTETEAAANAAVQLSEKFTSALSAITDELNTLLKTFSTLIDQLVESNLDIAIGFNVVRDSYATQDGSEVKIPDTNNGEIWTYFQKTAKAKTGGYTGDWHSDEGRWAILHQKELVVNSKQIETLLDAAMTIQDIAKVIDLNAAAASTMLGSALAPARVDSANRDVLQQNVSITAEFKDATSANEITAAFETLINRASQYANRK